MLSINGNPILATDGFSGPTFGLQNPAAGSATQNTIVRAQSGGGGSGNGAALELLSGAGSGTGTTGGIYLGLGGTTDSIFLSGAAPGQMFWSAATVPFLNQGGESSSTTAGDFSIQPQQSAHATDQQGGNFNVYLQAPAGAGVASGLIVRQGSIASSVYAARLSALINHESTDSALWLVPNIAPDGTNWALDGNSASTLVNGPTDVRVTIASGYPIAVFNASYIQLIQPVIGDPIAPTPFAFGKTITVTNQSGTFTLIGAGIANIVVPLVPSGGGLTGNLTVVFPNALGYYLLDLTQCTFNGHNVIVTSGSGSFTISGDTTPQFLVTIVTNPRGTNTIATSLGGA